MRPEVITVQNSAVTAGGTHEGRTISGTLATYGMRVHPHGPWYAVRLSPGALRIPAELSAVKLLDSHDDRAIIGSLAELDDDGGRVRGVFRVATTAAATDVLTLVSEGHVDGLSVGYRVLDGREVIEQEEEVFEVTAAELFEVSVVGWPADSTARIGEITQTRENAMPVETPAAPDTAPETLTRADLETAVTHAVSTALATQAPPPAVDVLEGAQTTARAASGGRAGPPVLRTADGRVIAVQARDRARSQYPGVWTPDGRYITAGDYLAAWARAVGPEGDSGEFSAIRAALADEITTDVPGLLPTSIIGELLGRPTGRRRLWDSLSMKDMPMVGEKFSRPKLTQNTAVNPQTAQKTEVASQKMTVTLEDVQKTTLAGALDIAYQVIDWTSPAFLNEVVRNFVAVYMARTDLLAATNLNAAATGGPVAWDGTPAGLNTALATAAGLVYESIPTGADAIPNTVWISTDVWVRLAGLTDTTGRPLLPYLSPSNASGQLDVSDPETGITNSPFRWVISKNLPDATMIVGDAELTESYENGRRFLQAERPDVLGRDLAYMGYVATYFPYPASLVRVTVPAPAPARAAK
ncbi:HK97 family phage prohead protease [Streptomyces sp. WMMC500]|uniref:HK97 family phage prohead protease n=1 Tax=Streptomyces sp. WMMC500 TaxID=3015154 RepID=UPI00248C2977|nr:HK97 family phage prohead protease [Streptomyces sp. WMMC500]WBB59346.1 HK97 family phage prohead protease [Streptomyces sp. WMMC500]